MDRRDKGRAPGTARLPPVQGGEEKTGAGGLPSAPAWRYFLLGLLGGPVVHEGGPHGLPVGVGLVGGVVGQGGTQDVLPLLRGHGGEAPLDAGGPVGHVFVGDVHQQVAGLQVALKGDDEAHVVAGAQVLQSGLGMDTALKIFVSRSYQHSDNRFQCPVLLCHLRVLLLRGLQFSQSDY